MLVYFLDTSCQTEGSFTKIPECGEGKGWGQLMAESIRQFVNFNKKLDPNLSLGAVSVFVFIQGKLLKNVYFIVYIRYTVPKIIWISKKKKIEPVTVGADATVYVWFLDKCKQKPDNFIAVTGWILIRRFRLCIGTVYIVLLVHII